MQAALLLRIQEWLDSLDSDEVDFAVLVTSMRAMHEKVEKEGCRASEILSGVQGRIASVSTKFADRFFATLSRVLSNTLLKDPVDPATFVGPDGEPALLWLQPVAACVIDLKLFFGSARADVREAVQNAHGLLEALPAVVAMQVHKADVAALNFDEAVRLRGLLRQQCYLGEKLGACLTEQVAGQVSLLIESVCCSGGILEQIKGQSCVTGSPTHSRCWICWTRLACASS